MNGIAEFFAILMVIIALVSIWGILVYVIYSYPMYKFFKLIGYEYAWLAWIPLCKWYALLKVSEYDGSGRLYINNKLFDRNTIAVLTIIGGIVSYLIPFSNLIISIFISIAIGAACRDLYSRFEKRPFVETTVLGYMSGFFRIVLIAKLYQYLYQMKRR
jgi:hypothetical protein